MIEKNKKYISMHKILKSTIAVEKVTSMKNKLLCGKEIYISHQYVTCSHEIDIKFNRFTFISNVHNLFKIHHNLFEIHLNIGLNLFSHTLHHWTHTDNGKHTSLVMMELSFLLDDLFH